MEKELNYKEAYLYVFNALTDLIEYAKQIQRNAELVCVKEPNKGEE